MTNSADPDLTAPLEQFDLGLHYFFMSVFPNFKGKYFFFHLSYTELSKSHIFLILYSCLKNTFFHR